MSAQRQDYLIRLIEELGRFVREVLHSGEPPRLESALPAIVQAQEKLFARPVTAFLTLPLEAQIDLLAEGESAATAVEKCVTYAGILRYAAQIYAARERPVLAHGSEQIADEILTIARTRWPEQVIE